MRQLVLIIVLAGLVLAAVGIGLLGAFPPQPTPSTVSRTLPNDRFGGR